jgi:hypothetical protein
VPPPTFKFLSAFVTPSSPFVLIVLLPDPVPLCRASPPF